MQKSSATIESLTQQVEMLETQLNSIEEALKSLLPLAITIPACTTNSAQAVKLLKQALADAEETQPRSQEFWYLASTMMLMLSSRAVSQHPQDQEVAAIFQGLRAHKKQ